MLFQNVASETKFKLKKMLLLSIFVSLIYLVIPVPEFQGSLVTANNNTTRRMNPSWKENFFF